MTLDTCFREEENDFAYVWWKKQQPPTANPKGHSNWHGQDQPWDSLESGCRPRAGGRLWPDASLCLQDPMGSAPGLSGLPAFSVHSQVFEARSLLFSVALLSPEGEGRVSRQEVVGVPSMVWFRLRHDTQLSC